MVTLAVTLILYNFMRSTAGEEYAIGAQRLMGFNGISSIQPINWPGDGSALLFPDDIFHLSMGCLILCYIGLKVLNRSHFGRVAGRDQGERTSCAPSCWATTCACTSCRPSPSAAPWPGLQGASA